jgi:predicted metal-dependent HD superfamily phosphohydrolase
MKTIPALSEISPKLWTVACELQVELANGTYSNWEGLYQRLGFITDQEWIDAVESFIPGWKKIATQEAGITAKHTLVVLACCMNLPEYQDASAQTRREIEWAVIFHDIDKDVQYGRGDSAHGVRSAAVAAKYLGDLGFDFHPDDDFERWINLVKSAQVQMDGNWVNDFSHLADITYGLRYFFGTDTPASRIIKAVLFHQSLPTLEDWPNPVILSDDQIRMALCLDDMEVLGPLMLGDSDAWNVCEPMRDVYMAELRGNIAKVRKIFE